MTTDILPPPRSTVPGNLPLFAVIMALALCISYSMCLGMDQLEIPKIIKIGFCYAVGYGAGCVFDDRKQK